MRRALKLAIIGSFGLMMNVAVADTIPYGMAGCGLGAIIIKKNGMGSQLGSAFVNNFIFPAWFAMTSGTSNCTEDLSKVSQVEKDVYIAANYGSLAKEAAQGSGEHLTTLAALLGCEGEQQAEFFRLSQERYQQLYKGEAEGLLNRYKSEISTNEGLAASCNTVG